jgi:hypothetical protein
MATRADLINMAMARTDELQPFSDTLIVSGGNALSKPAYEYASKVVEEAINYVLKVAQMRFIKSTNIGSINAVSGIVTFGSDFLLFVKIAITGGETISELTVEHSPLHIAQKHTYITATILKPVAVLMSDNKIKLYPTPATTATMSYVKKVGTITETRTICEDDMLPAVAWQIAGKVLTIMGDARGANAFQMASAIING